MECGSLIETKVYSELKFSDRSEAVDFKFIADNEVNKLVMDEWAKLQAEGDTNVKSAIFQSILTVMKDQLTTEKLQTVGQILDFFEAFLNMTFMDYERSSACIALEVEIFNNFFDLLPESWSDDPVKTHLLTKLIHENANDFNNSLFVCSKLIAIKKKLCCYVGLTLFWALYKSFFNDDGTFQCQKYYKMHSVNKFFKLLPTDEQLTNLSTNLMFKLLSLISIYVNYILLSDDKDDHGVFQEFFQCNKSDIDRIKAWLDNCRRLTGGNNHGDDGIDDKRIAMFSVIELLDYNLMDEIDNAVLPEGDDENL